MGYFVLSSIATHRWLVRFMIGYALPRSLGWKRLITGPGSTHALATNSVFRIGASACSFAFATALRMTFSIIPLARCFEKWRTEIASSTSRPRTMSMISRAFRGAMRAKRCLDSYAIATSHAHTLRRSRSAGRRGLLTGMAAEHPRRAELAQLVPDHIFLHEHLQELIPV